MPAHDLDDTALAHTQTRAGGPAPAAGDELPAGLRLGHFRIERKLGAGGMGEVYLATDLALDRPVAIKVLPAGSTSGAARERMIREARAQARVQHPNVAHIYFIGEDTGRLYFAMEYLGGTTLADRIATGPLPVEDALATIRAAVLGLREAQRSGFTHRDVKPSNLMIDGHGVVKVLDFGLAAATTTAATGDGDGPVAQTSLAGTPLYMAPEQARGEPIDLRADIYALGATLYHLISGHPPFVAESVAELISLHATASRPALPRGANARTAITAIDGLIARMMAPAPADRFASYDELLHAFELVSTEHTRPAGFWVRVFATGIDLVIATALIALILIPLRVEHIGIAIVGPVFVAYAVAALAWRGTTIGKSLFELAVVATDGAPLRWGRILLREAVVVVPTFALDVANDYAQHHDLPFARVIQIASICWIAAIFIDFAYAAWRRPGKRTLWDRVSHTQVRYRAARRPAGALLP